MNKPKKVTVAVTPAGVFFMLVLIASGCSWSEHAQKIEVGDCFDDPPGEPGENLIVDVNGIPTVPCSEPHENEVFQIADFPGSSYSVSAIQRFSEDACYSAFEPYVGRSYEMSELDFTYFTPTLQSWRRHDDREVICVLYHMDLQPLQGSTRDSGL